MRSHIDGMHVSTKRHPNMCVCVCVMRQVHLPPPDLLSLKAHLYVLQLHLHSFRLKPKHTQMNAVLLVSFLAILYKNNILISEKALFFLLLLRFSPSRISFSETRY